ncbi:hypothetical protein RHGRI_002415 [Rhododendron griersonianum]|uniref:Pentatricopeptide repeat-containing protein n=1 Tax=Rhododendron griersonianum TaxID=479676 RepID=A0AAV6LNT6_9ERIC|nr:hypothetical protein RHGRI_002415 [Rhododendron griersonianum]
MGFKHDYPSYSSLIYKLARCRNFEPVKTLLHSIKHHNIRCEEALFIGLIRHYGKSQLPEEAIDLFQQMTSFNCVRTLQSFNTLLNVLVDNGRLEKANEMFKCASKMGFKPNPVSFTVMIKGWLERGEWEQARRVFNGMLERGVEPSVVTYNCLVGYLCKKGDLDRAKGMLDDMAKKGQKPNAVTYSLLMGGLCSLDKYNEAKKMMFDMEYRGSTYRMMVDGFCRVEDFEGGLKLLNAMLASEHCPRLETFCCLIRGLAKCGKVDDVCFVLEAMEKKKMRFDLHSWEVLVREAFGEDHGSASSLMTELISAHQ